MGEDFNPLWITAALATIGAVVAVFYFVFRVGKWVGEVNVHKDSKGVHALLTKLGTDMATMLHIVQSSTATTRGSPLRLTDLGKSISEAIGAKEIVEPLARPMLANPHVIGLKDYQIQERSFTYIREEFSFTDEQEERVKECEYNEGVKDRGEVLDVLAIELRDALIAALRGSD